MKLFSLLSIAVQLLPLCAHGATTITESFSSTGSTVIPDGNLNGVVQIITPTTSIENLDAITVSLETSGGWNGDLYAYLWHGNEISVLLNRIGRSTTATSGSASAGMSITFDAVATVDLHTIAGSFGLPTVGTFQPDARNIHPFDALDSTPRTAGLDTFTGDDATGDYRLFIADVASGDTVTLNSWSITLTGLTNIPEPSSAILLALAAGTALLRRRRTSN